VVGSRQYERSVADLIIMMCSFAPMFACELWSGLASVADKTSSQFDWVSSALSINFSVIFQETT